MDRTLAIIKPDAVRAHCAGHIITRIQSKLALRELAMLKPQSWWWEHFYREHSGKPFLRALVDFMAGGPSIFCVLEGYYAVECWREMMGPTNPAEAEYPTLRFFWGTDMPANAVHGSATPEAARREIQLFQELHRHKAGFYKQRCDVLAAELAEVKKELVRYAQIVPRCVVCGAPRTEHPGATTCGHRACTGAEHGDG